MATIERDKTLLQEFLENLEQIPIDLIGAALRASTNEDEKAVINAFAATLTNQFKELNLHFNELVAGASKQKLAEADKLLKMSSGVTLVNDLKLALPSIGSIIGKLGIDGIIKEIKKIIEFLLEIFHVNLPDWVHQLVLLIDEIINDILGGGSTKVKNALSQIEQNYLAELTQLTKLRKATNDLYENQDDE